jgi:Rieske 2Fe-2S family protein
MTTPVVTEGHSLPLEKSLPSDCYTSPAFFAREREGIFLREWTCALRESELDRPGDHRVVDLAGESVVVVRGKDGQIHAHYNVCPHRGTRLCGEGREILSGPSGVLPNATIRCPYHSWTFALDGRLLSAPHFDDVPRGVALYPVGVATWGGFVFLNATPKEARIDLLGQLGVGAQRIERYPLQDLRSAHRIEYEVAANWKVVAENYNECYHCGPVHPELCEVVPAFRSRGGGGLDWEEGIPHRDGATTFTFSGTTSRAAFPGLSEAEQVRHKGELLYPNLFLSLSPDHVTAFTLWPLGPERTRIECDFLFHPEEMARPGFDPHDAVAFWDLVNRQDWLICEEVQKGLRSRAHLFGYYAPMEDPSLDVRRYVEARLGPLEG